MFSSPLKFCTRCFLPLDSVPSLSVNHSLVRPREQIRKRTLRICSILPMSACGHRTAPPAQVGAEVSRTGGELSGRPHGTRTGGCQHHHFSMKHGSLPCLLPLLPPWALLPILAQNSAPSGLFLSCLLPPADFPPLCQPSPTLCQTEMIPPSPCHTQGHETETLPHSRLGARMWVLSPVPRKPSLAAIGNNYWEPAWGHAWLQTDSSGL